VIFNIAAALGFIPRGHEQIVVTILSNCKCSGTTAIARCEARSNV
jgi:hypothetical protein